MSPSHVVVDGSNIATEGRSTPSLQQLDEAIREFQNEFPGSEVIVVVDATFGHRIEASERAMFDEAVAHGELVTPPAGAIGRGDAFVLRVAERVGAQVLSNDSFQEFHAEHPWLFDEGRLMGGKPVPGVGWIFTPRLPVRGPRSRAATSTTDGSGTGRTRRGRTEPDRPSPPTRSRGRSKVATEAIALAAAESKSPRAARASKEPGKAVKSKKVAAPKGAVATKIADGATKTVRTAKSLKRAPAASTPTTKAAKTAKAAKEPAKAAKTAPTKKATKVAKVAKTTKTTKATGPTKTAKAIKTTKAATVTGAAKKTSKATKTTKVATTTKTTTKAGGRGAAKTTTAARTPAAGEASGSRRGRRGRGAGGVDVRAAIEAATEEALDAPAAVNDPLTFLTFVTEHPLGSTVVGTVSSFVSHGAMVDVDGMSCYLPLTGLGDPPPRRAREVVDRGEQRSFVVVALDPPRRGAELALPELVKAPASGKARPDGGASRRTKKAGQTTT